MPVTEIHLKHGRQRNTSIGSFEAIYVDAREGHPLTARLGVVTKEERRYTMHVGDRVPVGDHTWILDRLEDPTSPGWTVVLVRVEE